MNLTFSLTDWLHVTTAVGSLLRGLGLLGTLATVLILARQTRAMQHAGVATAYQGIVAAGNAISSQLLEHPEILHTLRDPALSVEQWDFAEELRLRPQVAVFVTQQLDYFELVVATMGVFPRALQTEWRDYIRGRLDRSPYVRRALLDTDWYTADLRAIALTSP